jgi:hypothetical protein
VDRYLYVTKADLASALRADFPSTVPVSTLFPELNGSGSYGTNGFSTTVVSGLVLPNQQGYQFRYNTYAELARVVLPTGGAIEYDMAAGSGVVDGNNGLGDAKEIYRRVAARRTYKDGTTTPEGRTAYTEYEDASTAYIEADTYNGSTMLTCDRHHFGGGSARDNLIKPVDYQGYPLTDYPDALDR